MNKIQQILASFLFAFSVCFFLSADSSLPPDLQRILTQGKLTVAMYYEDKAPFFMHDKNNNFFGLDVDLARDIAAKLGVKIEFDREARTFNEIIDLIGQKKADIALSKISTTLDRAKKVLFTDPYITFHQTLLVDRLACAQLKRGSDPLKILKEGDVNIGVIYGTSYVDFAMEDFPRARICTYPSWKELTNDILKGKFLALIYDNVEILNWHKTNPGAALYLQTILMDNRNDPIAIAVHWQDQQLHSWLNQYLRKVQSEGYLEELRKKYIENNEWRSL